MVMEIISNLKIILCLPFLTSWLCFTNNSGWLPFLNCKVSPSNMKLICGILGLESMFCKIWLPWAGC